MFQVKIVTEGAAFHNDSGDYMDFYAKRFEVRRILESINEAIAEGKSSGACLDLNGNVVGEWSLT